MSHKAILKLFRDKTSPLIDLCDEITDCHHSTPKWTQKGKLVIRNFNIKNGKLILSDSYYTDESTFTERISRSKPEPGDLIITREAPMGEVCIIPEGVECCLGQRMVLIKPNKNKVNNSYLLYALQSEFVQKQIQKSNNTGSIVSNLRIPVLKSLKIPDFGKGVESQIASVLSSLDAKIELNNRINAELEAMAKLIYDYWFVQFDFPNEQGKPYKSSGGKMVYNKELKREIPEGWGVETLSTIANITTGKLDSNAEVIGGQYPFYTCSAEPTTIDNYAYDDSVILVAGNNARGNFHINRYKGKFNAYQRTYIITAKEKKYFEYIYQIVKLETSLLKKKGQGSQTKFITLGMLTGINIFNTNNSEYDKFYERVKHIFLMQMNVRNQNQQLASLRDWLLPMLMNGQVTVKEAEERIDNLSSSTEWSGSMAAEPEATYNRKNGRNTQE